MTEQDDAQTTTRDPVDDSVDAHLRRIIDQQKVVDQAAREVERTAADHKSAKARLAAAIAELQGVIRNDQPVLPFKDEQPDDWRAITVESLGLPSGVTQKLIDAGLETVGHIADHTTKTGQPLTTTIKGIGPAMADRIDDALDKVWEGRKEAMEKATGTTHGDGEEDGTLPIAKSA